MKAISIKSPGGPEGLELVNIPIPQPKKNEVRIKVAYCSMNPMDVFARYGRVNWLSINWPFIPGIEHSGVVDAVGENVEPNILGQRVHSRNNFGGNAEYSIASIDRIKPFPKELDWIKGTVYGGMTHTAFHVLHTAVKVNSSSICLFHSAAGAIGIMLTQIAKEAGAIVIGLCSKQKFDYAKKFGADHLIDYNEKDWPKKAMEFTKGKGFNIIVDGNQGEESNHNLEIVAPGGHIIYIGATAGSSAKKVDVSKLIQKSAFVGGFNLPLLENLGERDLPEIVNKIANNKWIIPISEVVKLEEVSNLNYRFEMRKIKGRVIIRIGGELKYDTQ